MIIHKNEKTIIKHENYLLKKILIGFRGGVVIMKTNNKMPTREYPRDAQTVKTNCPVTVNYNYG